MDWPERFRLKICLVGEQGVGKTSLIHRFVSGAFDPAYIRTLGVVVSKKSVDLAFPAGRAVHADLMVSDIMGQRSFLDLFRDASFVGVQGILAVFDVTRRTSLDALVEWIDGVFDVAGPVPAVILGNKIDLRESREVSQTDAENVVGMYASPILYTSARTGENVEVAFHRLARAVIEAKSVESSGARRADDHARAVVPKT